MAIYAHRIYFKKVIVCSVISSFFIFCSNVFAVDFFVDTLNGDDTNSCLTENLACETITIAVDKVAATGDTIHISAGTYAESLFLEKAIIFSGAGPDKTLISAGPADGISFGVSVLSGELLNLTIQNMPGNGINIQSATPAAIIKIENVRITENAGVGIFVTSGTLDIINVEISNNLESGIQLNPSASAVKIINTTVSGNNTENSSSSAGIRGSSGNTITFNNVTIANNKNRNFDLFREINISNSVVYNSGVNNCSITSVVSGGNNVSSSKLTDGDSCKFIHLTDKNDTDPNLNALAFNKGLTRTHAPREGSPLIDGGNNASCTTVDQRGIARPIDGDGNGVAFCDVGAIEVEPSGALMFPVRTKDGKTAIINVL